MTSSSKTSSRAWRRLATVLTVALGLSFGFSGCTEAQKEQFAAGDEARKRKMAERQLKERAGEYWNHVRWTSWADAAGYFEAEEAQLDFMRSRTDVTSQGPTIQDIDVRYVFVGGGQEEGEIRVSWTEVAATEGRVASRTATQRWYKHHGKWWVDPTEPLGRVELGHLDESAADEEVPPGLPTETP